jgi:hypothetical protein
VIFSGDTSTELANVRFVDGSLRASLIGNLPEQYAARPPDSERDL